MLAPVRMMVSCEAEVKDEEDRIHSEVYGERQGNAAHDGDCCRIGTIQNRDGGAGWRAAQKAQSNWTLTAKGEAYVAGEESRVKSRDKVLCLLRKQPDLTQAELANALGLTVKAIEKIVRRLRDANLIKREGGKKFGRWIVA